MDTTSIIDYIKQTYPKVVFTPFKFQQSRALAFIVSDNNLVIGFVNSNGTLCKLIEPVDISMLSSDDMKTIIEHIPIVKGFTDKDRERLVRLFEHKEETVTRKEHNQIVNELQKRIDELNLSTGTLDITNKKIKELESERSELDSIKSELTSKVSGLESERTELSTKISTLESERTELSTKISILESERTELSTKLSELQSKQSNLESEQSDLVSTLESGNKDLSSKISTLESERTDLSSKISTLESERVDLLNKLNEKSKDFDTSSLRISELESELQKKISELQSQTQTSQSTTSDLESTIKTHQDTLESKSKELDSTREQLKSSQQNLQSVQENLQSVQNELQEKGKQLESITKELETKRAEFREQQKLLDQNSIDILSKNADIQKHINQIKQLEQQKQSLEETLKNIEVQNKDEQNKYKALYDSKSNEVLLIQTKYEDKIKAITDQYNDAVKQTEQCRKQIIDQNEAIKTGINDYKESIKQMVMSKDLKIEDLERIHEKDVQERKLLQERLDKLLQSEKQSMDDLLKNKDVLSDYTSRLEEKSNRVSDLEKSILSIQSELDKTKQDLSKAALQNDLISGYKTRCKDKILRERDQIIKSIKDYNDKWNTWMSKANVNASEEKKKLVQQLKVVQDNLQSVLANQTENSNASNKEIQRLKQNITDIETSLKKTINEQLAELSAKQSAISEKDATISSMQKSHSESDKRMQSEIDRLKETNRRIPELQRELAEVKRLLAQNNNTRVETTVDFENCFSVINNFVALNNIFYRKQEIIKKLNDIIINNLGSFNNLSDTMKTTIKGDFERVKTEINNHIRFLNLSDYISSPNFEYLKSKTTRSRVPESYCKDVANLLDYWNLNKINYREQDRVLTNIYEDLSGAVRIYIRIKPLVTNETKTNTIELQTIEKKKLKSLYVDCSSVQDTKYKQKESFGEFYGIFEDDFTNLDVYTGERGTVIDNKSLVVNADNLIESSETISPGLYSTFKQVQDGYSIVIFGYGLSGSGKSHTLLGSKGSPGILHYGLANLENVKNIKLKNLFEQYYNRINFNNRQVTGTIHNLVNKISQFKDFSQDETDLFTKTIPNYIDLKALRVEDLYSLTEIIDKYRIERKRIRQTPNNPVSSRSHLYFVFEIEFTTGKRGYITIVDTAGRESPVDIFNTFIDTTQTSLASVMAPAPVGGIPNIEKNLRPELRDKYKPEDVFNILNEGFYVNETINHLIYYFNVKNGKTIDTPKQKVDKRYNVVYRVENYFVQPTEEERGIDGSNNSLMIPILKFLDNLSSKQGDEWRPTKFITICCVRQEAKYCDQTMETIKFAQNVKSS
jgi:DNA repair exonuclease SbcCD ATPase subunit